MSIRYLNTMEFYLARKKNMKYSEKWAYMEIIILHVVTQTQNDKNDILSQIQILVYHVYIYI